MTRNYFHYPYLTQTENDSERERERERSGGVCTFKILLKVRCVYCTDWHAEEERKEEGQQRR